MEVVVGGGPVAAAATATAGFFPASRSRTSPIGSSAVLIATAVCEALREWSTAVIASRE